MQKLSLSYILKRFIVVLLAVFVVFQVYSSLFAPFKTENVMYYTYNDVFAASGIVLRNEILVKSDAVGTLSFDTEQGARVAKGGTIASVYPSAAAIDAKAKIKELDSRIALLSAAGNNSYNASDLETVDQNITNDLLEYLRQTSRGKLSDAADERAALEKDMNRKPIITGKQTSYSELITALTNEKASLESTVGNPSAQITAPESGYFISGTDGYENAADLTKLDEITPQKLKDLKPQSVDSSYIGKIVSDYKWYIAALIPLDKSVDMQKGDVVKIDTGLADTGEMSATVQSVNRGNKGEDAAVIFSCENMNSELAEIRNISFNIINKTYSGLRVSTKALRIKNGEKGVYVLSGQEVKFRKVTVLYSGESFIICKKETDGDDRLKLYDEAVVAGKNLYDGKVVK